MALRVVPPPSLCPSSLLVSPWFCPDARHCHKCWQLSGELKDLHPDLRELILYYGKEIKSSNNQANKTVLSVTHAMRKGTWGWREFYGVGTARAEGWV